MVYALTVARTFVADESAANYTVTGLQRAVRLNPQNAEFAHSLGLQLSRSPQDYESAIVNLRRAATLNPYNGDYWLDLASVYDLAGKATERNAALEAALAAQPNDPDIAAEAANYFLVSGDTARAVQLLRRALERDPSAATPLLPVFWRATHDARLMLDEAIPPNPELQVAFLNILTEQNAGDAAAEAWRHIIASGKAFPPEICFFYFNYLLSTHDAAAFGKDWADLATAAPSLRSYLPGENLIINGSFELPVLFWGLDWRHEQSDHISWHIDNRTAHEGSHSLMLIYDGNVANDAGWHQFVPVQPGSNYMLSAWIKSDDILSSSGPRLEAADAFTDTTLGLTTDVLDTHPWQKLETEVDVPDSTSLILVKIVRSPANSRIRGRVWIDDIRMEREMERKMERK